MSLCDGSWDLVRSYGVRLPSEADALNVSAITDPVFRHWCQQKPVSELSHYFVGVLLVLICVISIIGNLLVVVVFTSWKSMAYMRANSKEQLPEMIISDVWDNVRLSKTVGCKAYAALCGLLGLVSIVTLTAIAVERCLVISVKPWHGTVLFTHSKAKGTIGIVWLYCLSLVLPPIALGWGAFVPEGFLTSCSFDYLSRTRSNRAYFFFLFSFGFFLPITLIGVCYTFILQTVFQNERAMKLHHVTKSSHSKVKRSEYRAAEMILMVIALFLISWTPYSLIACLGQFGDKSLLTPWVSVLPSLFAKMSTLYNPAIYGISHRHFRTALKRMFEGDSRRSRSGTYFSRNSSLSNYRRGCPCLPLNCTTDALEDNSSSLTGKKICLGSPQDNCRAVYNRKSRTREGFPNLCVCSRMRMVPRDFTCLLDDPSICFQHIPRFPCRLHSDQSTSCMCDNNSMCRHAFCRKKYNNLIKSHAMDIKFEQRQKIHEQAESINPDSLYEDSSFVCRHHVSNRCFYRFQYGYGSCNDFINPSILKYNLHRPKCKMFPYKRKEFATSMESGLVGKKSILSVHQPEISYSSVGSVPEFYDNYNGFPLSYLKQHDKLNTDGTIYRKKKLEKRPKSEIDGMYSTRNEETSTNYTRNEEVSLKNSCKFSESTCIKESLPSYNCKNMKSERESVLFKHKCCKKIESLVLEAKSENTVKLEKLPHNELESTQSQNSTNISFNHEEMPMCVFISRGFNFATKKFFFNKEGRISNAHPSLIRSLMFHSERSIHQKYQTFFECDRIIRVPTSDSFQSEFFRKCCSSIPKNRRATVVLESGQMKNILRNSSGNET
ncbi:Rhodopsin like protein [Argiope bruennichi]|uniref:Rhodopsin like protein n=1 Tax=Argiope bruennichi TaxID=94029 RepID=A0A8T0FWW9_ARGBR|nr:Rhodopsin like protein [Argiope bruennichi]